MKIRTHLGQQKVCPKMQKKTGFKDVILLDLQILLKIRTHLGQLKVYPKIFLKFLFWESCPTVVRQLSYCCPKVVLNRYLIDINEFTNIFRTTNDFLNMILVCGEEIVCC